MTILGIVWVEPVHAVGRKMINSLAARRLSLKEEDCSSQWYHSLIGHSALTSFSGDVTDSACTCCWKKNDKFC